MKYWGQFCLKLALGGLGGGGDTLSKFFGCEVNNLLFLCVSVKIVDSSEDQLLLNHYKF